MNLRILSTALVVTAASVLWMSAASASATTLISSSGTAYTSTISAEAEGHVVLHNPVATIECSSKVEGKVESHGEGVTAGGNVSSLSFTGCTNGWHVTTVSAGSLQVHATGGGNGTVTSSGTTVEATRFGVTCRYATNNTDIGTLTGGSSATLDIAATIPFHSGSFLCGSSGTTWTGSYSVSTPSSLAAVDAELEKTVKLDGVVKNECNFDKAKIEVEECTVEFKVTGKGTDKWKIVESELIAGAGHFKVSVGCTKGTELAAGGAGCTDLITNIKNESVKNVTWCVKIDSPGIGAGPHCTTLNKP